MGFFTTSGPGLAPKEPARHSPDTITADRIRSAFEFIEHLRYQHPVSTVPGDPPLSVIVKARLSKYKPGPRSWPGPGDSRSWQHVSKSDESDSSTSSFPGSARRNYVLDKKKSFSPTGTAIADK
jgi:hypothetical protein